MYEFNPYALLPLASAVVAAVLSILAWLRRTENRVNHLFAIMAALGALWFLCVALSWLTTDAGRAALWCKLAYVPGIFIPSLLLHLALMLAQHDWLRQHPKRWYWLYLPVPFLGVALAANLLIVGALRFAYGYSFDYGPLHTLYVPACLGSAVTAFAICAVRFRDTQPGELLHHQLKYALLGLALPAAIAMVTFGILPLLFGIRTFPFASSSTIVTMALMSYAVLKRRLFDIVPTALRDVVTHVTDGVVVLDREQRIVSANPAFRRMFALERPVVSVHLTEALGPAGERLAALLQAADSTQDETHPLELILEEPSVALEVSISPVTDEGGRPVGQTLLLRDISARKRREETLHHLSQVGLMVQQARSPEDIFSVAMAELAGLGFAGAILLLSEDKQSLRLKQATYGPEVMQTVERLLNVRPHDYPIPISGISVCEAAIRRQETVFVEDGVMTVAQVLPSTARRSAEKLARLLQLTAFVGAPLVVRGEAIGMIVISSHTLSQADAPAVSGLANQVAVAIENAYLREQAERQAEVIQQQANRLRAVLELSNQYRADIPMAEALQRILERLRDTGGFPVAWLILADEEADHIEPVAWVNVPDDFVARRREALRSLGTYQRWLQPQFQIGNVYLVPHVYLMTHAPEVHVPVQKEHAPGLWQPMDALIAPIWARNLLLGFIEADVPASQEPPDPATLEMLEIFANQAAAVIENARLYEQARHRLAQLEALRQGALEIAAQLELEALLRSVVPRAVQLLQGASGGIHLYRPEQDVIEWTAAVGPGVAPPSSTLRRGEGLSGKVWQSGEPLIVDDYQRWEGRAAIYEDMPFKAVVGVPIRWGDEFLGVLNVLANPPRTFSRADADLLGMLAAQAATAIRNAQLHAQTVAALRGQRHLTQALHAVSRPLTLEEALPAVVEAAAELLDADGAIIALLDVDKGVVTFPAIYNLPHRLQEVEAPVDDSLAGRIIRESRPVVVDDYSQIETRLPQFVEAGIRGVVGVPIVWSGAPVGALSVVYQGAPPVEVRAQIPVLESLAAQAAIVIEHTRLYERIRRSEARYASLVESSPEAILIVQDGRIRFFNQAAEELWGYKVDEVLGTPFDRYWTEESRVELRKCRQKRPAGEAVSHRCEMVALSKSGAEIPVEVDIALVEYTGEAAMMLFVRDISARKKLDRLREDLSHMLIHDLRNPLNTISGVVRVLEEEADAADPMIVRQTADIISRSVQRMMTLIDNYLEIGRLEAGQMPVRKGPIAPDQVVAEAIDTMRSLAAAKEIALVAEVTPDIPVVAMDGDLIVRVLINLLDNAIKFSPRGKKVKVGLVHEDDGLLFSVSDQGPGIPLEEQERVFHKYAQLTRSKQRGLGLGLAFCKLAVETHGGRIWVESEPGDSTTFYFILPPETG